MGNQKAHRREARKAKEEARNFSSLPELGTAVKNGEVKLLPEVSPTPAPAPEPMTKAGVREYNDFFGLFAKSIREKRLFRPLGFIPGPAAILNFREGGETQIFAATSDVARELGTLPTPYGKWEELPEKIRKALGEWKACVDGIGYEPSGYNLGLARGLLEGRIPAKYLAMTMPHFRYRPGDPELPFGVVLLPVVVGGKPEGMKVAKVYNPGGIPDVPAEGTILTLDELKNRGPIQKLLRTWALMETNFLGRYDREGNRRQNNQPRPQPQSQAAAPQQQIH